MIIADKPKISTNNPFVKDSMNAKKSFDMHYKELVPALILDVPIKTYPVTSKEPPLNRRELNSLLLPSNCAAALTQDNKKLFNSLLLLKERLFSY